MSAQDAGALDNDSKHARHVSMKNGEELVRLETVACEGKTLLIYPPPSLSFSLHSLPHPFLPLRLLFRPHLPSPFLLQLLIPGADPRNRTTLSLGKGTGSRSLNGRVWDTMMVQPVRMVWDMVF